MTYSKRSRPMVFQASETTVAGDPADSAGVAAADRRRLAPVEPADPPVARGPSAHAVTLEAAGSPPSGAPVWILAAGVALLWALGPIAFAVGYRSHVAPLQNDPFALAVFALLAVGPAALIFGAAYVIRQGQKLAFETRRSTVAAEGMLSPAMIAAARAGDVAIAVREEIDRASAAAEAARDTLTALRESLAFETEKLAGATAQSVRTVHELADTLGRERGEMSGLALTLDAQAVRVTDAVAQQARMVADAASVAETQIREAETALAARAADLAAAGSEASDAARTAGEDLTRHIARLESAGAGVADQVRAVESGLSEQRTALVALGQTLKSDHETFAADADAHAARLSAFIEDARRSAQDLGEQAASGGETLRALVSDAAHQFRELSETARAERAEFGQSTLQSLEAVSSAAAEQRVQLEAQTRAAIDALAQAAEETRSAAARHAAAARDQVDQLSEAAFSAGQKANQVFEARLEEARALVEQSSKMVEDAGAATARKLEAGTAAARAMMDELAGMLGEIETRAQRLPAAARGQAQQVRDALADGMDELMAQARRTAEEAQAIDAAFQDRVRRNFQMLSEAVRLMGVAAVAAPGPSAALTDEAAAPVERRPRARSNAPTPPTAELLEPLAPTAAADFGEEPDLSGAALADRIGLRSRIKLTPTATDREFSAVFEAAGGPPVADPDAEEPAAEGETWTWKDLLASLDGDSDGGERLEDSLAAELGRMGIDPDKLLPGPRLLEVAAAVQAGDAEGGREAVRKLAPAATRRLARRLLTDETVRRQSETFVRRYRTLIGEAAARDPAGHGLASLFDSDGGRIFLLLDAAGGDLA